MSTQTKKTKNKSRVQTKYIAVSQFENQTAMFSTCAYVWCLKRNTPLQFKSLEIAVEFSRRQIVLFDCFLTSVVVGGYSSMYEVFADT